MDFFISPESYCPRIRSPRRWRYLAIDASSCRAIDAAHTVAHAKIGLHLLYLRSKLVFCSPQSLLEATKKLVLFAIGEGQIVISQLTVFLFQFALNFVPSPL